MNNYSHDDHLILAATMAKLDKRIKRLISYDNTEEIRKMYQRYRMSSFDLNYTLQNKRFGSELLVFSNVLQICEKITVNRRINVLRLLTE